VSHFVAAILVSIDTVSHMVEVWSGGCPPPFMLTAEGECEYQFASRHLAMGILTPNQFDSSVEYYSYENNGSCLVMFSDGIIELENESGEHFGLGRLFDLLRADDSTKRWVQTIRGIEAYGGDKASNNDDIALMMVQCESSEKITSNKLNTEQQAQNIIEGSVVWQFALTLTMHQIKKLDVVPLLLDIVQQIEKDKERSGEIFMILSEIFNNALDHGVLKLDSSLKHHEDGLEKYFDERAARLANTETGHVQLNLEKILNTDGTAFLRILVSDSGEGFDYQRVVENIATSSQRHGRGISLLHHVCRTVQYLNGGSEILVEFDLPDADNKLVQSRDTRGN
jgi:anti-sigma regulatory factor (Ser/Thr protein kinase)